MDKQLFFIFLLLITSFRYSAGQDLDVHGQFQVDSIEIGSVFPYSLSLSYSKDIHVLFPDSSYSFAPFEFHHKTFFPTRTNSNVSYDSVVYFLSSFEIDSIQKLALPVFIVHPNDCTLVQALTDSVFLVFKVDSVPESVPTQQLSLKTDTTYHVVKWQLDYYFFIIAGAIIIFVGLGIWIVFGKHIRTYFLLRKLNKKHTQFIHSFDSSEQQINLRYSPDKIESAFLIWKKYMESLIDKPFTKYTSKEIFQFVKDTSLHEALQQIDQRIYDREKYSHIDNGILLRLRHFSEDCFQDKIMETKNG